MNSRGMTLKPAPPKIMGAGVRERSCGHQVLDFRKVADGRAAGLVVDVAHRDGDDLGPEVRHCPLEPAQGVVQEHEVQHFHGVLRGQGRHHGRQPHGQGRHDQAQTGWGR